MNKSELVDAVAERADLTKKDTKQAIDAFMDVIQDSLQSGQRVSLVGFGSFEVRERKARKGHNPQTGEPIQIPAAKVPAFKAGKTLKEAVDQ